VASMPPLMIGTSTDSPVRLSVIVMLSATLVETSARFADP
jgi:hypothetical protein